MFAFQVIEFRKRKEQPALAGFHGFTVNELKSLVWRLLEMSFLLEPMKNEFRLGAWLSFRDWALVRLSVGLRGTGFVDADRWRAAGLESHEQNKRANEERQRAAALQDAAWRIGAVEIPPGFGVRLPSAAFLLVEGQS
jgi:hypothetical protein